MIFHSGLRLLLEVVALIAIWYWGFQLGGTYLTKLFLSIGFVIIISVIWGTFGSPHAPYQLKGINRLLLEFFIFGLATFAIAATQGWLGALIYALLVIFNRLFINNPN